MNMKRKTWAIQQHPQQQHEQPQQHKQLQQHQQLQPHHVPSIVWERYPERKLDNKRSDELLQEQIWNHQMERTTKEQKPKEQKPKVQKPEAQKPKEQKPKKQKPKEQKPKERKRESSKRRKRDIWQKAMKQEKGKHETVLRSDNRHTTTEEKNINNYANKNMNNYENKNMNNYENRNKNNNENKIKNVKNKRGIRNKRGNSWTTKSKRWTGQEKTFLTAEEVWLLQHSNDQIWMNGLVRYVQVIMSKLIDKTCCVHCSCIF